MPRARLLKPGFFKNVTLARLSERHRLLYAGLWTLADREGRLKDEPAWIKAEVFPYEVEVDVNPLLTDLQHAGFIVRYTYGDNSRARTAHQRFRAIAIPAFSHHQTPHHREPASQIPAPTSSRSRVQTAARGQPEASLRPARGQPQFSPTVPDPVPVTGDPVPEAVPGDPVPETVSKEKSSAALRATRAPARTNGNRGSTTTEDADRNVGIITKIAHEAIALVGIASSDLAETIKSLCATRHIAYDSAIVRKAIESAQFQRRHQALT